MFSPDFNFFRERERNSLHVFKFYEVVFTEEQWHINQVQNADHKHLRQQSGVLNYGDSQHQQWHTYCSVTGAWRKSCSKFRTREWKLVLRLFSWSENLRNSAFSFFRPSPSTAQWHSRCSLWSASSAEKKRSLRQGRYSLFTVKYHNAKPGSSSSSKINKARPPNS